MLGKDVLTALLALLVTIGASPAQAKPAAGGKAGAAGSRQAHALGAAWTAYDAGHYADALKRAAPLTQGGLVNRDYALYLVGQAAYHAGKLDKALDAFQRLRKESGSRFAQTAVWREADCQWELGRRQAARDLYTLALARHRAAGIATLALFRIGQAELEAGHKETAITAWRKALVETPRSPWETELLYALNAVGDNPEFTPGERLARAQALDESRRWEEAVEELEAMPATLESTLAIERDYAIAEALFSRRRQYERAGKLYLGVFDKIGGDRAARALFKGARALSRADKDDEAIRWYAEVVRRYPNSTYASEAQFLEGWLQFNAGKLREGLPALGESLAHYGKSQWADDARWYLGFSYLLLGDCPTALPHLERLASGRGELSAGKGAYWAAWCVDHLGRKDEANERWKTLVGRYPLSWYALLAQARLKERGLGAPLFADASSGTASIGPIDKKLVRDPRIARVDELLQAGWNEAASYELERVEKALRTKWGARALPVVFDRYGRAGNFNRPWELAEIHGGRALDQPPKGAAKGYWELAYPRAYRAFIEKHQGLGKNPPYWLYSIMRKESGFDPHDVSYADAIGLLQMIPPTTMRVAAALGQTYDLDRLFDPEWNIQVGSWYIGGLFAKFQRQVPLAAGSFNAGPNAVVRWLEQWGKLPLDEFVERVSYTQTREYMKKVTGIYAHYLYLYEGRVYEQPLSVNPDYAHDELTY